jgi:PAS domain S-box-containing protein
VNAITRGTETAGFDSPITDLSAFATTPKQRFAAAAIVVLIATMTFASAPFSRSFFPTSTTFLIAQATASGILLVLAGYILYRQAVVSTSATIGTIAVAYLTSGGLQIAYLLAAPVALRGPGVGGANQAAAAYTLISNIVFPLYILGGFLLARSTWYLGATAAKRSAALHRIAIGGCALFVAYLATGVALRAIPHVLFDERNMRLPIIPLLASVGSLILGAACVTVYRADQGRTVTNLWVTVSLLSFFCESTLFIDTVGRFTVAWYVARLDGIIGPAAMVAAIVYEGARMSAVIERTQRGLRSLVDGMTDAMLVIDANGRVMQANPAAVTLFQYTTAEFVGMDIDVLVPKARDVARGSRRVEMRGRRQDGELFPVEIGVGESARDETSSRTVIVRDITQRIRAEAATRLARDRALEATQLKSEFLATMSHEIRTPINAVIGMSELLLEGELAGDQREYAQTVRDSASALLAIINDILDFSKLEAGKMALDAVAFSPLGSVEAAADILASEARRKRLSFVTYIAPDIPEMLQGDANRLRQILLNLIGNAIKFTKDGGIVVHAKLADANPNDVTLHISVADTGIGLSEETRLRLFEAFVQADGSTSRRFGGTGLGLSISKRLVNMMGGEIGVESVEGMGSTFWFTAKFARSDDSLKRDDPPLFLPAMRCIVVDDDPDARAIIQRYLQTWGLACDEAGNVGEALALVAAANRAAAPYDVVLCDMRLPDGDGITLARHVRGRQIRDAKFILVTAFDEPRHGAEAIAHGFVAYLRKPFRRAALYDALVAASRGEILMQPLEFPDPEPAPPVALAVTLAPSPVRILLVEDHPVNRRLVLKQLEKLGYAGADSVNDGAEAIAATANVAYDLVLMDCQMPVVDGFAATRAIRSREKATGAHVPIVALTANALEGDREACLAAGMDAYVSKPVKLVNLREIIVAFALSESAAS